MLTQSDKKLIIEAITKAELKTTAEIKIHISRYCIGDEFAQAKKIFKKLGLTKTKYKNAVLIFVAHKSRKLAILGDSGINDLVEENFWQNVYAPLSAKLAEKKYSDGLIEAVNQVAEKLTTYFPAEASDTNEISNDISGG